PLFRAIYVFWYWSDLDCAVLYGHDACDYWFCRSWSIEFFPGDWGNYRGQYRNDQYRLDGGFTRGEVFYHYFCLTHDCCRRVTKIINPWPFGLIRFCACRFWSDFLWD